MKGPFCEMSGRPLSYAVGGQDSPSTSWTSRVAHARACDVGSPSTVFAASAVEASAPLASPSTHAASRPPGDVDFDNLDKTKFFVGGAALFSGVTCCLYPLTVIKTRQMVDGSGSRDGALAVVREILRTRGVSGLYQGFGTVVVGTLPIRAVYLSTLELVRARARDACVALDLPPMAHGAADAAGGAVASSFSQILGVPIDVISQRQMVSGVSVKSNDGSGGVTKLRGYANGAAVFREIFRKEGVRGFYRGFGASVATLVPGSALWWGFYGTYQRIIWHKLVPAEYGGRKDDDTGNALMGTTAPGEGVAEKPAPAKPPESAVIAVQIASGICAGMSSGFLTTPLDIVKTRLQVLSGQPGNEGHTFVSTARALYAEHGASGFLRGVRPRMTSVAIWGTTMVTAYEFLKRLASTDTGNGDSKGRERE